MANKKVKYTFLGENKDVTKSKHPYQFYYEGQHIRITATDNQTTGSITNEKGNEKVISIPDFKVIKEDRKIYYNSKELKFSNESELVTEIDSGLIPNNTFIKDNYIIGHAVTRTGIILFATSISTDVDSIWYVEGIISGEYNIELLYTRSLNFSLDDPIQAIYNYENENVQKVYWVDNARNQIRHLNIKHNNIEGSTNLIDIPKNTIESTSEVSFSQPIIESISSGGTHTAGKIQYAYNLFRLNSSQTKISPLSQLVALDKGNVGGGDVNEVVGAAPNILIEDVDQSYDYIRIYAIKYTSYNEIPSVSLIAEIEIKNKDIQVFDDGSIISSLSIAEFLFLGNDPIRAKHIFSKGNRLFPVNIKKSPFVLPEGLDCRAYSFSDYAKWTSVYDEVFLTNGVLNKRIIPVTNLSSDNYNVPISHSAINLDYDKKRYLPNSNTEGGEGKFIRYKLLQRAESRLNKNVEDLTFLKDDEIYRIGIQFYNTIGNISLPQWIADFKAPSGNLDNKYNILQVELKPEFYTFINNIEDKGGKNKIVGYKIIRANRTEGDKTIFCQGISSGMMVNTPINEDHGYWNFNKRSKEADTLYKMPNILMRNMQNRSETAPLQKNKHLQRMQFTNNDPNSSYEADDTTNSLTEIQFEPTTRYSETYQYTSMFQIYSPEIKFNNSNASSGVKLRVKGGCINKDNKLWAKELDIETKKSVREVKVSNGLSPHSLGTSSNIDIKGPGTDIMDRGIVSNENGPDEKTVTGVYQYYRNYTGFTPNRGNREYKIFGKPEFTQRGKGVTSYNGYAEYKYINSLEGLLTDGEDDWKDDQSPIVSVNSWGDDCLTVVLGKGEEEYNSSKQTHLLRTPLERLYSQSSLTLPNCSLLLELIIDEQEIYVGNIYGGNTYENKKRTNYIEIGSYKDIEDSVCTIENAGDVFVQNYKFLRLAKTNTELYRYNINQFTEIIEFKAETSIDLKNRSDESKSSWDSTFQFNSDRYYNYNDVYSQQPTLLKNTDVSLTFREIENFDTMIQASKLKIPNEPIDSWTDILTNETMNLDGRYGPINGVASFKDDIYTFQDNGIAHLQINPRVQLQTSDGLGVELGTGKILYDYNYLTTSSGSINKWGIKDTDRGIYYYDALRKGVGRVPDYISPLLSDVKGQHTFFNNNYIYESLKKDNPLKNNGVIIGEDNYNNDVYITTLQNKNTVVGEDTFNKNLSFTKVFNENADSFIDHKLYIPNMYINKGDKFLLLDNKKDIYEQFKGDYNKYFGKYYPSYVILMVNPDSDYDKVFNNIQYNSELYLNNIDQPHLSLTHIQAWSEYQNSGKVPLKVGRSENLRRKFREWKALIPRNNSSKVDNNSNNYFKRDRIRNPWIYLKLELDNESNYRLVLHDIIISYTI